MMNIIRLICAISTTMALVFVPFLSVGAAVVNYDESIDGDIFLNNIKTDFYFDTGVNTIHGSQSNHIYASGSAASDSDQFRFTVPAANQLTAIDFTFTNLTLDSVYSSVAITYSVQDLPYTFIEGSSKLELKNETPNTLITLFPGSSNFPLSEHLYNWGNTLGAGGLGGTDFGGSWDYTLRFHVSAVPLPTAFWLFFSGLLGLISIARKKTV